MGGQKIAKGLGAVLLFGAFASGCMPPPQDDDQRGTFCAQSAGSTPHCVPARLGAARAWKDATEDGSLPIEMWAEWPAAFAFSDVIANADRLNAWFSDVDTALAYVRDTQRNAESYKASLEREDDEAWSVGLIQETALDAQPTDVVARFEVAISGQADKEKSAVAADKQAISAAKLVFLQREKESAPLTAAFSQVSAQFVAYRATEAAETQGYVAFAKQASAASLDALPDVEHAILTAAASASAAPNDLSLAVMQLAAEIQTFEVASQAALAPHADALANHGAKVPDMSSRALRSLNAMLGYIQARVARSDATAASLLRGVAVREQALLLLDGGSSSAKWNGPPGPKSAGQASRDAVALSLLIKAGAAFHGTAEARLKETTGSLPASAKLKLPYLARRSDAVARLLLLEPLCDPSSSSWREEGCVALRPRFGAAKAWRAKALPGLISTGIALLRKNGGEPLLLDAAQQRLDAGDVRGAAVLYDAAVAATEAP